jgi:hypothetical protein
MRSVTPEQMAKLIAEIFERAGQDAELSERMSFAETIVHLHFESDDEGTPDAGCTLFLDRMPITGEVGLVGSAEIELFGPTETFSKMVAGREALPMAIARGDVTYTGPVRKFLRVVPLLQTFNFEKFRGGEPSNGSPPTEPKLGPVT